MKGVPGPSHAPEALDIQRIITDVRFPLCAAQQAYNVDPLLTAHTFVSVTTGFSIGTPEEEISYRLYPEYYGQVGMLRALAEQGVVHIPTSDRNVINDSFHPSERPATLGSKILSLLREIRSVRK